MKTADYSRFVTAVILPSDRISKSKVEDNIEMHAVPFKASSTVRATKLLIMGTGRAASIVTRLQVVKPRDLGLTPRKNMRFFSCT